MKKFVSVFIACVMVLSVFGSTVFSAYEAPTDFTQLYDYNGRIYTTSTNYTSCYDFKFETTEKVYPLPDIYYNGNYIYVDTFCIYHDKLYILEAYSSNIFSCNLDGSGARLLADNANNSAHSKVSIVDGVLYYTALYDPEYGYYGGIYSINLYDLSWKKICNDGYVWLLYCDGNYVYYGHFPYIDLVGSSIYRIREACAIKTDGTGKMLVNSESDEVRTLFSGYIYKYEDYYLKGNQCYYISGNQVYVRDKNGYNSRLLGSHYYSDCYIVSVTDDYVYCYAHGYLHRFSR